MRSFILGLSLTLTATLTACRPFERTTRPATEPPHLVSMAESAQALQAAGAVMISHGQAMSTAGQRTADQDLVGHGDHWQRDGSALDQRGQWLAQNPLAPASLRSSPGELSAQNSWGELTRTAEAMLHDPGQAREIDLEALRWNGLAMRAEGQNMDDHARLMTEEVELMIARHGLDPQAAAELRQAVDSMQRVAGHLTANGQAMIDYADRLRRSLGSG